MATGSRAQMLAMPLAITIRWLAHSSSPALVSASRPNTSQNHSEPQPSASSSAIASRTCSAGWTSSCLVHNPTRPNFSASARPSVVVCPSRSMLAPSHDALLEPRYARLSQKEFPTERVPHVAYTNQDDASQ